MKIIRFFLLACLLPYKIWPQLKDIKIMIPKEIGYNYYDFMQFLPDEKSFVVCGNGITIINTETSEIIDEYDLAYGAKNISVSPDGKHILATVNHEIYIFSYSNQKINLLSKVSSSDLIQNLPNGQYYTALPITGCFFTQQANEIYVAIGSYTILYNYQTKTMVSSHTFPIQDYIVQSTYYPNKQEVILAKSSGTLSIIESQSLKNLNQTTEIISNIGSLTKIKTRDSLLLTFTSDQYLILDLSTKKIIHEIRMPKYDYSSFQYDPALLKEVNKRVSITKPDTINFAKDEYIYDIDFHSPTGTAIYAGSKGLKFIDLKTKKITQISKGIFTNIKCSNSGNRLVCNGYTPYKALRVMDPNGLKLISETPAMGTAVYSAAMSHDNRWLYTNGGASGFLWDLRSFSKYAEIKDISGKDSSFISNAYFINDSEMVINSGLSTKELNLSIYNIHKKKYTKTIKKGVYAFASGFMNQEFYYCDYKYLHIINLKTGTEETYEGLFSLAASPLYQVIQYTKNLVFIPEANKYKIVNRQTKKTEYESSAWSVNAQVIIDPDEKFVYTVSQINKKKNINGTEIEMPVNAVVKIDMTTKSIVQDYAQTYFPYDFRIKNEGKVIGIWYVKYDLNNYNPDEKEVMYTEYDTQNGQELFSRSLAKTPQILSYHYTSEHGKYFALLEPSGSFFQVFDDKGNLIVDLSDSKISMPKCFFNESKEQLIATSISNSLATFIDLKNKKTIGQLANASGDRFFLITSNLHYMGSKDFVKNIRFKYQSEIFNFEQFDAYLNQPHQVLTAFGCSDSSLIKAYETAYLKRLKLLGIKPDSKINFSSLPSIETVKMNEEKPGFVNFNISANQGANTLSQISIYNNGSLVLNETINSEQNQHYQHTFLFETSSGINRFEFIIKDAMGIESPHISRFYNNTQQVKPNLYLAVIGSEKFKDSDYDLTYAVKDASDMANTITNSKSFNHIEIKKVFNQNFTTDSISSLKKFFSKAGINDVAMIFFAGHGYLDTDFSYYFPTYYTDFTGPKINSVSYQSFESIFKNIKPLRKLMFIDACYSGEVDEENTSSNREEENQNPEKDTTRAVGIAGNTIAQSTALEMSKAIFSDIRQNSGITVISSAGGTETALEGEKWNNGLFTHCLLEGLKGLKADLNNDKKITLNELQKFVAEEVYRLSNGKQTPTYRVENNVLDYELWE